MRCVLATNQALSYSYELLAGEKLKANGGACLKNKQKSLALGIECGIEFLCEYCNGEPLDI